MTRADRIGCWIYTAFSMVTQCLIVWGITYATGQLENYWHVLMLMMFLSLSYKMTLLDVRHDNTRR